MRFDTSQSMKLGQQMKLAPRMIQSMEILQMPLAELQERIEQELESNIALELDAQPDIRLDPPNEQDQPAREDGTADSRAEEDAFSRLDDYVHDNPDAADNDFSPPSYRDDYDTRPRSTRLDGEPDAKSEAMANTPARSEPLAEQLLRQWSLAEVDPRTHELGAFLIEKLEDDGYLRTPLESIAKDAPRHLGSPSARDLERALVAMQFFLEPAGIGARDARECLLLQLDALEDDETWDEEHDEAGVNEKTKILHAARTLVEDHLDDLMNNRLPKIAEKSGLGLDKIKQALQLLRRLSLAPARRLVAEDNRPITPDAIIEYDQDNDRYIAYLNDRRLPNLNINREYALLSRDRTVEKKDRDFIKTNLSNAQWLIDAVEQRRSTLLRVINVVLDAQRDYFDYGPQALKPLPMTQVAEQLGVHVATVSRAVSGKHLMTPRGVVPLRSFFSGGMQTDDGEDLSYDAIKAALKEIIDAEDKKKPLSDDALVKELKSRGIEIARRTVAKYRSQLGIPTARLRKSF
ncbi:MAG: RNA polymerase factor sigma-54 [Phycisphaerales bacterium]|nr:RNA polymerase factor sigma-54 [Phycisphaerales bacterium]